MSHSSRRIRLIAAGGIGATLLFASGRTALASGSFSTGELASVIAGGGLLANGCGVNAAGEPSIHVSRSNDVLISSERGIGLGTDTWVGSSLTQAQQGPVGGPGASACSLHYDGQPNAVGVGLSGGDTDSAWAPTPIPGAGTYAAYVASLNAASVSVSHSLDNGTTWQTTPLQLAVAGNDREWIASYGLSTSLLTVHDAAAAEIHVMRSDDFGVTYTEISQAIPPTGPYGYAVGANQIGNVAIDHVNPAPGLVPGPVAFRAYQAFVAPSTALSATGTASCIGSAVVALSCPAFNQAFVSVSNDGGFTWTAKPIPCSVTSSIYGDNVQFPIVSVAPNGSLWETWSDWWHTYVGYSPDQGNSWTCTTVPTVSNGIMPWIVAGQTGEDLVYYGWDGFQWNVYFDQNTSTTSPSSWDSTLVVPVHGGGICISGAACGSDRQLFDDFGVDVDQGGWAHIAYSHDCSGPLASVSTNPLACTSPPGQLGGGGTYTGYAVQTGGTTIGAPN